MNKNTVHIIAILFSILGMNAYASSTNTTPSPEAYDACSSLKDGETCHFKQGPHITRTGICQNDSNGKLVCVVNK